MRTLLVLLMACLPHTALSRDLSESAVARRLAAEDFGALADEAFDTMFHEAAEALARAGRPDDGYRLLSEWHERYQGVLRGRVMDTGDHAPLSAWVAGWYAMLEEALGVTTCELLHLRDIWVLNYTIPVVFEPNASSIWCVVDLSLHPGDNCRAEYNRHFSGTRWAIGPDPFRDGTLHHGFAGVVTYWLVFAGCEAALAGGDAAFACSPAATVAEAATERWVAPRVAGEVWDRRN